MVGLPLDGGMLFRNGNVRRSFDGDTLDDDDRNWCGVKFERNICAVGLMLRRDTTKQILGSND